MKRKVLFLIVLMILALFINSLYSRNTSLILLYKDKGSKFKDWDIKSLLQNKNLSKLKFRVRNISGQFLNNYQFKINFDLSEFSNNCNKNNIGVYINSTPLPYWIEDDSNVTLWTKISLNPDEEKIVTIVCSENLKTENNGNKVFEFFDDFNKNSLDTNKWTNNGIRIGFSNGWLIVYPTRSASLYSNKKIPKNTILEYIVKIGYTGNSCCCNNDFGYSYTSLKIATCGYGACYVSWSGASIRKAWNAPSCSGSSNYFHIGELNHTYRYLIVYKDGVGYVKNVTTGQIVHPQNGTPPDSLNLSFFTMRNGATNRYNFVFVRKRPIEGVIVQKIE